MRLIIYLNILILLGISQISQAQNMYFPPDAPSNDWETTAAEDLGWCTDSIQALYQYLDSENTRAFLVLKDGKIVLEQYFGTHTQDSIWVWFSAGKSLRAALVGIAQEEGLLNIQDKTSDYLGRGWTNMDSLREDSIKIWHQLTMTTGIDPNISFDCTDPTCLEYAAPVGTQWVY
ncbi:MAG: beta-lactamase family protein, partial [Saprospiraceae bacterium]|nr:beta-lactamase family protein [Saprospiraceae bacterium]